MNFFILTYLSRNEILHMKLGNDQDNYTLHSCSILNWSLSDCQKYIHSNISWVIATKKGTSIGIEYLLSFLNSYSPKNIVIGRIGCLTSKLIQNQYSHFQTCYPYPIIESGFVFSFDLLSHINFTSHIYEEDFCLSFQNSKMIDDFHFNFFPPVKSRKLFSFNFPYLISFFTHSKLKISEKFLHAAGFSFDILLSSFSKAKAIIGEGIFFRSNFFETEQIHLECGKHQNWSQILTPPLIPSKNFSVKIKCYDYEK